MPFSNETYFSSFFLPHDFAMSYILWVSVCVCVLNESGGDFIEFRNRIHMNRMKIEFRIIRHLDLPYNKQARSSKKV